MALRPDNFLSQVLEAKQIFRVRVHAFGVESESPYVRTKARQRRALLAQQGIERLELFEGVEKHGVEKTRSCRWKPAPTREAACFERRTVVEEVTKDCIAYFRGNPSVSAQNSVLLDKKLGKTYVAAMTE